MFLLSGYAPTFEGNPPHTYIPARFPAALIASLVRSWLSRKGHWRGNMWNGKYPMVVLSQPPKRKLTGKRAAPSAVVPHLQTPIVCDNTDYTAQSLLRRAQIPQKLKERDAS